MITVKSIKKEPIGDLVTRDAGLEAYMSSREVQKAKKAIADTVLKRNDEERKAFDAMIAKKHTVAYKHYIKTLRKQAVECVKDALFEPYAPVLKNGVLTLYVYALDCGMVTSDPSELSQCVEPPVPLGTYSDITWFEIGLRLLYALEQDGVRISVSFTFPDELQPCDCDILSGYDGFNELVNTVVDAVLEWEIGRTEEIWDYRIFYTRRKGKNE